MTPTTPTTPTTIPTGTPPASWPRVLGYAAFLACSWTWCIGMYLPVILARDLGPWSFLVFALPNCLGAAAMGVLLWRPSSSARLLAHHAPAARVFSLVTLAFQVWFLGALLSFASVDRVVLLLGALGGLGAGLLAAGRRPSPRLLASGVMWAASIALVALWLARREPAPTPPTPDGAWVGLLALLPVCAFGFALCPYLDLTFHAARQSLPGRAGTRAFLLGFLVLFPCMILLTAAYAPSLIGAAALNPARALPPLVAAHIAAQLVFTGVLHVRSADDGSPRARPIAFITPALALVAGLAGAMFPADWLYEGLTPFEVVYRTFMGFYGLAAPAYVLLCVLGAGCIRPAPDRRTWTVLAVALVLATPLFWVGFLDRETIYAACGVAIILMAKAFVRPTPPAAPARPARST